MYPNIGGIDPKKIDSMMKKMGIQNKNLDATKVIIETTTEKIIINNPVVTEITMQGQKTFQVMGEVSSENQLVYTEEDVSIVSATAEISEEQAKQELEKNNGDLAKTIDSLKKEEFTEIEPLEEPKQENLDTSEQPEQEKENI